MISGPMPGSAANASRKAIAKKRPVAEIPNRGDTGREGGRGVRTHPLQQCVVGSGLHVRDRCSAGVETEMDMGVDQPGQQGRLAEVDDLGTPRRIKVAGLDRGDAAILDEHQRSLDQRVGPAVEQPSRSKRQDRPRARKRAATHGTQTGVGPRVVEERWCHRSSPLLRLLALVRPSSRPR